jgi:diguanylate cyclase (GGDEF)-like protein/PAS domain S-box-containing protein
MPAGSPVLELPIEPRRLRRLFVALLVGALLVIWGAWLNGIHALQKNAEGTLSSRIEVDTLLLEDHASRALDAVAAQLQGLPAGGVPSPAALQALIDDGPMIRSVSLVDPAGRVVASSSARNLGLALRPGLLPGAVAPEGAGGIRYGEVLPGRDLADLGRVPAPARERAWLVARPLELRGQGHHWLAVLDPGNFEALWARLDENPATEIGLFDRRGRRIAAHHSVVPPGVALGAELVVQAATATRGSFVPGGHPKLWATWRGSARHPVVVVAVGHQGLIWDSNSAERAGLTAIAGGATLVVLLALALLYRGYLRYEASVIETANQVRAIGAHLMSIDTAPDGTILRVNQALLDASGYSRDELVGRTHGVLDSGLSPEAFREELRQTIAAGRIWKGSLRNRRRDGGFFWVNATIIPFFDAWGRLERYVTFYSDVTEAIALAERFNQERQLREELARANRDLTTRANTDPLTGVGSRHAFDAFVRAAVDSARGGAEPFALLMLDLDRFKDVNDLHGHVAGDTVLRTLARRWAGRIRASDLLARIGGEEFCVVLPGVEPAGAVAIAEALRTATSAEPVSLGDGVSLRVTVSIGVAAVARGEAPELQALLRRADAALYAAKRGGRNRVVGGAGTDGAMDLNCDAVA